MSRTSLGELLKDARRAAGFTQEALAARAGVSARAISDLERNVQHTPRPTTMRLLATALGLSDAEREHFEAVARAAASNVSDGTTRPSPTVPERELQPAAGAVSVSALIGRADERMLLDQHLAGDGPPVMLLTGEPGIGKTRLLHEASALAATRGLNVLSGTVPSRGERNSMDPIADVLRRAIQARSPVLLRQDLQGCAWLVRMLPELADGPLVPAATGAASLEQQPALIANGVVRFMTNTAGPNGTLLVLDDLHHADGPALAMLARIVRSARDSSIRVVAAYRDGHLTDEDQLSWFLGMLAQENLAKHIALRALSTQEATDLLSAIAGNRLQALASWSARAVRDSGGVPFYVVAFARGLSTLQPPAADEVPWTIQQSIRSRINTGPAAVRPALEALAVAGGRAMHPVLARVGAQRDHDVAAALEWAARERLVNEDGEAYAFAYEVVRAAVEADLTHPRRVLLRRRLTALVAQDVKKLEPARSTPTTNRAREYHLSVLMRAQRSVARKTRPNEDASPT